MNTNQSLTHRHQMITKFSLKKPRSYRTICVTCGWKGAHWYRDKRAAITVFQIHAHYAQDPSSEHYVPRRISGSARLDLILNDEKTYDEIPAEEFNI